MPPFFKCEHILCIIVHSRAGGLEYELQIKHQTDLAQKTLAKNTIILFSVQVQLRIQEAFGTSCACCASPFVRFEYELGIDTSITRFDYELGVDTSITRFGYERGIDTSMTRFGYELEIKNENQTIWVFCTCFIPRSLILSQHMRKCKGKLIARNVYLKHAS